MEYKITDFEIEFKLKEYKCEIDPIIQKEISDTFDGMVYEQLTGAQSVVIALKRYRLRKMLHGEAL